MPAVSIIMPAYNASKFIGYSIESVLNQSFIDWELIVVDDCSSDNTVEIVKNFCIKDSRITILHNEVNLGSAETRNRGITAAKAPWIAFIDSDDLWHSEKLRCQMSLIHKKPEIQICYTASSYMNEDGQLYSYILPAVEKFNYKQLLGKNLMMTSSVLVKKELMLTHPMVEGPFHEDYDAWLKILKDIPYAYGINRPLIIYRMAKGSKSFNRVKSGMMTYRTYRHVGYGLIHSWFLVFRYFFYSVNKRRQIYSS